MPRKQSKKVLIVEDDRIAAALARHILEQEGYEVVAASDGEAGLEMAIADEEICLVVLDIVLPGIDGYQVCHQLRLRSDTERLPVVMLTAKTGDEDRFTGLAMADANAYLTKPVDPDKLKESVNALVEQHPNPRAVVNTAPSMRRRR